MGYQVQLGFPLTFFHPVRDTNGNYIAGQASAITKQLLKPDRTVDTTTPVSLTDHVVAGWVRVNLTLASLGAWTLILGNPDDPTADGLATDYPIAVQVGMAGGGNLLTSLDRVRLRMNLKWTDGTPIEPGQAHELDDYLNLLISEVSDEYQRFCGRTFGETPYTEYLDGSGRGSLVLGAGPLVSFTSLSVVDYQDDGAGGVTEVLTVVPRHTYVLAGLRAQPRYTGLGRVDLVGGATFTPGPKRFKAVYVAGFDVLPEALVGRVTEDVVYRAMTRDTGHLLSKMLGDGSITYMRPQQMQEVRQEIFDVFRLEAA